MKVKELIQLLENWNEPELEVCIEVVPLYFRSIKHATPVIAEPQRNEGEWAIRSNPDSTQEFMVLST